MRRAAVPGWAVMLALTLAAALFFIWIVASKTIETGTTGLTFGCKLGKVTKECPCNGIRVISGYCCENGPSARGCSCGDEKYCSDYTTKESCIANECTSARTCVWGVDQRCY